MTKLISRKFLKQFDLKPFNECDYACFAGVSGPFPMIAMKGSYVLVVDGDYAEIYLDGYEFGAFEVCENIRELPLD